MPEWRDELTGAYARAALTTELARLDERHALAGAHYATAMVDLDHLKTLNDSYGHAVGDAALRAVAERCKRVLRPTDKLFRYGGDEFIVLLPGSTLSEAEAVMRRVKDEVTANPVEASAWVNVTVSIGVAATDENVGDTVPSETLFERADKRLYVAKRAGRAKVVAGNAALASLEEGALRETRLMSRDEQLALASAFITDRARSIEERALTITGSPGAGFTRYLDEVAVRGRLTGRAVRRVNAAPADHGVYLRALTRAYGDLLPLDATEAEVRERLAQDADARGLLLLVEGGANLDPGSRALINERLRKGGAKLIEAAQDGASAAFAASRSVALEPLEQREVAAWLGAALAAPIEEGTVREITRAAGGLPARVGRLVTRLKARGALDATGDELRAEATDIAAAATEPKTASAPALPQWDAPLIGRGSWLKAATRAARTTNLITLVGPGGAGKSRLAAQLALELARVFGERLNVHWVDLRGVTSAATLPAMIGAATGAAQTDDLMEIADALAGSERLLVLDEVDGLIGEAGALAEFLKRTQGVRLITTCRAPLRLPEERVMDVPELRASSAAELFRRGMQRAGATEQVSGAQLRELLNRVGLSPLAVELAAAWTRSLSLAELTQQLELTPALLTRRPGTEPRTARLIDVTRNLMSGAEQAQLGALALIPGGFTADAARAVAGASPFYLLALLERHLLRREGERYTVHAAIAERFAGLLKKRAAAKIRVARHYSSEADRVNDLSGERQAREGFRWVDAEFANLKFALETAIDSGEAEAAWPVARLLRGYFDVRGRYREALELFRAALANLPEGDGELRGWLLDCVAIFHSHLREYGPALAQIDEALAVLEPRTPGETLGLAWNTRGVILGQSGDYHGARAAFERSAEVRRETGDALGVAQATGNIAITLGLLGEHEKAITALKRSVEKYREVQHESGVAISLISLAKIGREHGLLTPEERLERANAALELSESIGFPSCAHGAALEAGEALLDLGRAVEARGLFERGLRWAQEEENPGATETLEARVEAAAEFEASAARDRAHARGADLDPA